MRSDIDTCFPAQSRGRDLSAAACMPVTLPLRKQFHLRFLLLGGMLFFLLVPLEAQEEPDIRSLLNLVNTGNEQLLQKKLPQLLEEHPGHPGLLYLQALLTTDADQAVAIYQSIVADSPASDWADDALFKLCEYYYAVGAVNVAAGQFAELKKRHPGSPFIRRIEESMPVLKDDSDARAAAAMKFSVQAGAFSTLAAAQGRLREIRKLGYTGELRTKLKDAKKIHAVWIGEFSSFDQAALFARKMKQRHDLEAVVVRK